MKAVVDFAADLTCFEGADQLSTVQATYTNNRLNVIICGFQNAPIPLPVLTCDIKHLLSKGLKSADLPRSLLVSLLH